LKEEVQAALRRQMVKGQAFLLLLGEHGQDCGGTIIDRTFRSGGNWGTSQSGWEVNGAAMTGGAAPSYKIKQRELDS